MNNPQRMCIICRQSMDKNDLFRLTKDGEVFEYDEKQINQSRGIYVCESLTCIEKLSKHKKYKVSMKSLATIAAKVSKKGSKLLNSLKAMKNSGHLTFGIEMVEENINKIKLLIIAKDCNQKNEIKLIRLCKEKNIKYIITASRRELGDVFSKEEINTIGVMGGKAAQGLLD